MGSYENNFYAGNANDQQSAATDSALHEKQKRLRAKQ